MASLDDVWDGGPNEDPTSLLVGPSPPPSTGELSGPVVVSGKVAKHVPPMTAPALADNAVVHHLESLVLELHELRREQARRTTVYIILVGILFATLIVYIDRLQQEVRSLKSNRPLRFESAEALGEAAVPFPASRLAFGP